MRLANAARTEAKRAIGKIRAEDFDAAGTLLSTTEKNLQGLSALTKKHPDIAHTGYYHEAVEEYAEAIIFQAFLEEKKPKFFSIAIGPEELLAAAADATGELVRHATAIAHEKGGEVIIKQYHTSTTELLHELTAVAHTGKLRQKYDEAERNAKRFEQML